MTGSILAFLAISAVVIITPGQDTALTVRNSLSAGKRGGISTALGVACGQMVWALATALGVVAILAASEMVFTAVKLAGAGYLIFLGFQSLRAAFASSTDIAAGPIEHAGGLTPRKGFIQGVVSNLCNPKMAAFFASLLPQFVPPGEAAFLSSILLGLTFCTMTFSWLTIYAVIVEQAGNFLRRPKVRRSLEGLTGIAMVGLGLRIATTEN